MKRMALIAASWLIASSALAQAGQIKSERSSVSGPGPAWYGSLELRHHLNTFYDQDGYLGPQEPSAHARVQLGAQLYEKMVDIYATLGVYKLPRTQQVLQRRPQLALDFYPVRNPYFTLLQYNIVHPPFLPTEQTENDPEDDVYATEAGAIYTVGLAPEVRFPFHALGSTWKIKGGFDSWTRLFSRRQYTENYEDRFEDESRFETLAAKTGESSEPIEDTANHYRVLYMGGFSLDPGFAPALSGEATVNYDNRFDPRYTRSEKGVEHHYVVERRSYYRLRLKYEITDRVALLNDFYHFHGGFFESKRDGDDRRFRNIARITCRL